MVRLTPEHGVGVAPCFRAQGGAAATAAAPLHRLAGVHAALHAQNLPRR